MAKYNKHAVRQYKGLGGECCTDMAPLERPSETKHEAHFGSKKDKAGMHGHKAPKTTAKGKSY